MVSNVSSLYPFSVNEQVFKLRVHNNHLVSVFFFLFVFVKNAKKSQDPCPRDSGLVSLESSPEECNATLEEVTHDQALRTAAIDVQE